MKTLEEVLVDAIEKAQGATEKGVEFAIEQTPDLIQQALYWHATFSVLEMLCALVIIGVAIKLDFMQYRWICAQDKQCWDQEWLGLYLGNLIGHGLLVFVPVTALWSLDWLKILIAPKLWLLEYAVSLAK